MKVPITAVAAGALVLALAVSTRATAQEEETPWAGAGGEADSPAKKEGAGAQEAGPVVGGAESMASKKLRHLSQEVPADLADIDGTLKSFKANGCTPNSTNPTCVKLKLGIDKKAVTYYNKYGPSQSAAAADILRSLWDGSVESFSKVKGSSVGALVGEGSAEEQCPCSCTPENAAHCEDICEAEKMACDRGKGDPLSAAYTSLRNLSRAVALHRKAKLMAEAGRDLVKDIKRNETESQIKMLGLIGDRLRTVRPARPGGNLWDTHESSGGLKQKGASKTQGGWGQPFQSAANKGASR